MGLPAHMIQRTGDFIDKSKRSLKCVLLHNGKKYVSIPIGHFVQIKQEYDNIKTVLEWLQYHVHGLLICVDLKMVNFLLRQEGTQNSPVFFCYWDSTATADHWVKKKWPPRHSLTPGDMNIINDTLVDRKIIVFTLLPAHKTWCDEAIRQSSWS